MVRSGKLTLVATSAPIPWPLNVNGRKQKWSLIEKPNSTTSVWIGNLGGVIWDGGPEQMRNELATFEERTCSGVPGNVLQDKIEKLTPDGEKGFSQFAHGIIAELPPPPIWRRGNSRD